MTINIYKEIQGLKPVNPIDLKNYELEMAKTIPKIIQDVKKRQILAAEARQRILILV